MVKKMKAQTEWTSHPFIEADNRSSVTSRIDKSINKPLPWFCILSLVIIFLAAQSYQARTYAFDAQTTAMLAEQHFKDYTDKMDKRMKESDEYVEKLRFELASHGIRPPPKE
jgi:hypothetical protein